jgi:hypothetical protein
MEKDGEGRRRMLREVPAEVEFHGGFGGSSLLPAVWIGSNIRFFVGPEVRCSGS